MIAAGVELASSLRTPGLTCDPKQAQKNNTWEAEPHASNAAENAAGFSPHQRTVRTSGFRRRAIDWMVASPRGGRRDKHYWPSFFEQLARRMRDPRTDAGKAWLSERSLLTRFDPITRPLLISQETHHPRVKRAGNDQSAEAMTATHSPVNYVRFAGETTASADRRTARHSTRSRTRFLTPDSADIRSRWARNTRPHASTCRPATVVSEAWQMRCSRVGRKAGRHGLAACQPAPERSTI